MISSIVGAIRPDHNTWDGTGTSSRSGFFPAHIQLSRKSGGQNNVVTVPENVVPLGEQVRHRPTCRDVGEKPERVLQVGEQPRIRIGEWWRRFRLEAVHNLRCVLAGDNVQPLLDVALVLELGVLSRAEAGTQTRQGKTDEER